MNEKNKHESMSDATQVRLADECSQLDKGDERSLADQGSLDRG